MVACARAEVRSEDPTAIANGLAAELGEPAVLVVFASWQLRLDAIAKALAVRFPGAQVVGCTSAGEIGPGGVGEGAVVALAMYGHAVRAGVGIARDLQGKSLGASRDAVIEAAAALGRRPAQLDPRRHAAITLFDGRSRLAEGFCLATASSAPQIQFVGGAASDRLGAPPRARMFVGETVIAGGGVVMILETELPFAVVGFQHSEPTPVRTVVTRADHDSRLLQELDGCAALPRYRELVAGQGGTISDATTAQGFPLARYVAGKPYVRSIAELDGDALRMAAAVDQGQVLRLMRAGDIIGETERELARLDREVGNMCALLAFSCLGRHLEARHRGIDGELAMVYSRYPVVGFHSFGEQSGATLVNATLTGLALGGGRG